jgi:hypothetical protein
MSLLTYIWIQLTGCKHENVELKSSLGRSDVYECKRCNAKFIQQK